VGLESINKATAATQSVQTAAPVTPGVQAAGSSTQTTDYASSQTAQTVQLPFGQDSASAENAESKATLADVKDISKVLNSNTVAEFGVYEPMNRITIKIKDKETGEVLKEIPSEKMLKMFTKACELAGLLVDEKM
jgi:flagellar protein FlaG